MLMFFVAGEMGGERGRRLGWIGKSGFVCDGIDGCADIRLKFSSGVASGGDKSIELISRALLRSMFSDRLTPERMLFMDNDEAGEVEVAPKSELAFNEYDSWKGVEG